LRLADARNPEIAVARERIREALARQERVEWLWLPTLEVGPAYTRHDGQIQRTEGQVITVSRSSLAAGAGAALAFDLGEALFAPLAARQLTAAREAGAAGVANERLLDVALAYLDLLQVYAELAVSEETVANARHLLELTESYERSGRGAAADAARARTEVHTRDRERTELFARTGVVSARLTQRLRLDPVLDLRPAEPVRNWRRTGPSSRRHWSAGGRPRSPPSCPVCDSPTPAGSSAAGPTTSSATSTAVAT
jgi:outer membrane protein TolC